ncbi:hypothetical protein MP228_001789 [Amoeboaphelidium protococcarum]|nr:hypothetical protein MP228_001789 [Amoeboaphelidium protococcarum]
MSQTQQRQQNNDQSQSSGQQQSYANDTVGHLIQQIDRYPIVQEAKVYYVRNRHLIKPWSEFMDLQRMSLPQSSQDAINRIQFNVRYFALNYIIVTLGVLIWFLITRIDLLLVIVAVALVVFWISNHPQVTFKLGGNTVNMKQRELYILTTIIALPLLYWASAGSVIFWFVILSASLMLAHAVNLDKAQLEDSSDTATNVNTRRTVNQSNESNV